MAVRKRARFGVRVRGKVKVRDKVRKVNARASQVQCRVKARPA